MLKDIKCSSVLLGISLLIFICLLIYIFINNKKNLDNFASKKLYDRKKCFDCIKKNRKRPKNEHIFCTHCGSETINMGCIPPKNLNKISTKQNCISKDKNNLKEAQHICHSLSDKESDCRIYTKNSHKRTQYMNDMCGDDYYCAYDTLGSCSQQLCEMDGENKYYDPLSHCICTKPNDIIDLPTINNNIGRICKSPGCPEIAAKKFVDNKLKWYMKYKLKIDSQMPLPFNLNNL